MQVKDCKTIRDQDISPPVNAYKNVEAVTFGYNIFKGSPFAKNDRGRQGKLFLFDWSKTRTDSTQKTRPKEVNVAASSKCSSATSTTVAKSEKDVQESFSSAASVGGSGLIYAVPASFKASNDYKSNSNEVESQESTSARATA